MATNQRTEAPRRRRRPNRQLEESRQRQQDRAREAAQHAVALAAQEALQQACGLPATSQQKQQQQRNATIGRGSGHSVSSSKASPTAGRRADRIGLQGRLFDDSFESDVPSSSSSFVSRDDSLVEVEELQSCPPSSTTNNNTESMVSENGGTKNQKNTVMHRKWSILKKMIKPPTIKKFSLTSEISNEAWMCGVCVKSFSSFEAAQKHEEFHIREVVAELGFGTFYGSDSTSSFGVNYHNGSEEEKEAVDSYMYHGLQNNSSDHSPTSAQRRRQHQQQTYQHETPQRSGGRGGEHESSVPRTTTTTTTPLSNKKPRPDVLSMSSPALLSTSSSYPDNTPALQRTRKAIKSADFDDVDSLRGYFDGSSDYNLTTTILRPSATPMSPIQERRRQQQQEQQQNHHRHQGTNIQGHLTVDAAGDDHHDWNSSDDHGLILPLGMRDYVVLVDEALADVCDKAIPLMLTPAELDAELELEYLAQDKAYYDMLYNRAVERRRGGRYSHFRTEGKSMLSKVQNKFVDAYQLMKEGNSSGKTTNMDHYTRKLKGDIDTIRILENNRTTLYVNVIVKASLEVVSYELQRLAKQRWEAAQAKSTENDPQVRRFQQFRALAQDNLVKLAGMALASDFTPRRIAIQLSNDLYRLLTPRLKRRGVSIETEIEYRVGPYFVLAVNVKKVDWKRLVKGAHKDVSETKLRWQVERKEDEGRWERPRGVVLSFFHLCYDLSKLTKFEVMAQVLAWCYYLHWSLYTPVCFVLYHTILGELFRNYFLATVSDEIFYYVEQKGMEMDIGIRNASTQAAFMLSALREIRADGKDMKKKHQTGEDQQNILGPLLGPAIKEDKGVGPQKPPGFEMPESLEFIGLELELPVGFRRLRWALLSSKSTFLTEAVFKTESKYENITVGPWSKHDDAIGLGTLPVGVSDQDIVGAEKEITYLMPKSAFVKANTCYETSHIDVYSDYCFVVRKKTLTPEVPYGSTFVAWTKYIVINTGVDSCKLICSVEAEFPNGPPMISRQIKNGMRAGVGELFVKIGETINKYADHYP